MPSQAVAQSGVSAGVAAEAGNDEVRDYRIPSGSLDEVLNRFGRESGLLLSFTQDQVQGLSSPGVHERATAQQALNRLLAGTGLVAQRSPQGALLLRKMGQPVSDGAAALSEVTVTSKYDAAMSGYAANDRPTATKLGGTLMETPRSVSIVSQEQLKNQAPKSIEQALSYTAGVTTEVTGADLRMTGAIIRGFSDGSSYYKDGLRQFSAGTYGSWNDEIDELESIEVIKGPASVLFGQGRPGGVINVVSKKPEADHVNSVGISYGRYRRAQLTADLGGALSANGDVLYRLNLKGRDSNSRTVGSRDDRISIAPSLRWNLSAQTHLTLLGSYSRERGTPKSWWPSLFTYPQIKNLSSRLTAGDPAFDRFDRNTRSIGYEFGHLTDSGWQLSQPAGSSTLITASVFDLRQSNVITQDPAHPRFSIQTGEVRSTGLELEARIRLTRELSSLLSYTWLDPRTTQSTRAAEVGRQTLQTTRHAASIWLDYRPRAFPGLMLAGGVRYKGRSPYNVASDGRLNFNDAVTVADLAVAYDTPRYRIALNINNLFNKTYFAGIFRGVDREANLSVKYYW